jgi:hypothetical protein
MKNMNCDQNFRNIFNETEETNCVLNTKINEYKLKIYHLEIYADTLQNDKRELCEKIENIELLNREQTIQIEELKKQLANAQLDNIITIVNISENKPVATQTNYEREGEGEADEYSLLNRMLSYFS